MITPVLGRRSPRKKLLYTATDSVEKITEKLSWLALFFFSRTMCLGFTITASWSKMPLMTRKLSFTSEVKFVYLWFLRNFYIVNHLNNTKSPQMLLTS
jgi:hypothetical protein